ncbi:hypothetical protein BGX38DRAFT_1227265 [Terfezia claveryi]|nr:hypothetical protein BGX38DRAFT_1227265 [Terfezia claveryi]
MRLPRISGMVVARPIPWKHFIPGEFSQAIILNPGRGFGKCELGYNAVQERLDGTHAGGCSWQGSDR